MVELSIIIPFYNSEKYIGSCLNSICKQIEDRLEIIIVNDGSTDNSAKICKFFSKKYKNIKIIDNKTNFGVSYSRNEGLKKSTGKYIFFFDSDDLLIEDTIHKILLNIKKIPKKEIFILRSKTISQEKIDKNQFTDASSNKKNILRSIKNFAKFRATCWNFIIQKKFLNKNKIKFKNIKVFEDQVFVTSLLCCAKKYKVINEPIYLNRIFEPNTLSKKTGYIIANSCVKIIHELINILFKHENLIVKEKVNFLKSRLNYASDQLFIHILNCSDLEIKKITKYLLKYYFTFSKILKLNIPNLIDVIKDKKNIEKNLFEYKEKKISLISAISFQNKKKLILFCAGSYSNVVLKLLLNLNAKVHYVIDNNVHYSGKKLSNIEIKSPIYLKKNFKNLSNYNFLVCNKNSSAFLKIKIQLCKIGFKNKKISQVRI